MITQRPEGFVARHHLYDDERREAAERALAMVEERELRTIRIIWVDQHGLPRCKFASPQAFRGALTDGLDFSGALVNLDSGNHVFTAAFAQDGGLNIPELTGFPDVVLVPDPRTFQVLPWADHAGWVLAESYLRNGKPHPLDSRLLLQVQLEAARRLGYEYTAGLEVEFYILRNDTTRIELHETGWPGPPPAISIVQQGYQYLSETRLAGMGFVLDQLRDALVALGLPLRSMEDEWGPGQIEITFHPTVGLAPADAMVLFRSTAKQICQRHGLLATFMSRPAIPNVSSSGWHLHQSLRQLDGGANAFAGEGGLSEVGRQFAAGILEHALAMAVFAVPTLNGYKRYRPYSFAPDNVNWALENRGAMLRVQADPGDPGSHLENRMGEPAANPYLYLAANLAAGLDGIERKLVPPPMTGPDPYAARATGTPLPTSLWEAVAVLDNDGFYRRVFGDVFVDFIVAMKRGEVARFLSEVTDWEMREYLENF